MSYTLATGRRKTAIARIYITSGNGNITVNGKSYDNYFTHLPYQVIVSEAFKLTEVEGQYDVKVNVTGGGLASQAEAVRHGISQALVKENEDFKKPLKDAGYVSRDDRMKERKKAGLKKARKRSQYRKR
jgi:small subunit ribosomal protein S9